MKLLIALVMLGALACVGGAQTVQHGVDISAQWSGTGTACFNVYRATASGSEGKPPLASCVTGYITGCSYGTGQTFCWTDTTAVVGTKYYHTTTATAGGVESAPSSEVSAQIVLPNAPTNPETAVH